MAVSRAPVPDSARQIIWLFPLVFCLGSGKCLWTLILSLIESLLRDSLLNLSHLDWADCLVLLRSETEEV